MIPINSTIRLVTRIFGLLLLTIGGSTQAIKLTATDATLNNFGISVSTSGNRAAIGANYDVTNGGNSGSVYIFELLAGKWTQTAKLLATDGTSGDLFGYSVSILGDRVLIGAYLDDEKGRASGSAYVFDFLDGSWVQTAKLQATDGVAGAQFGVAVSLSGDRALIGAKGDKQKARFSGSAYIFDLVDGRWSQATKLIAKDGTAFANFGNSVSLSGNRALIGASGDDTNGKFSGSAYIFELSAGSWSQAAKLIADDTTESDLFGTAVSLSGNRALIGASGDDDNGNASGSAYIFELSAGYWSQTTKLLAIDGTEYDDFGSSVSLSGNQVLIGAKFDDDNGSDSGSAYMFTLSASGWSQTRKLIAQDGTQGDRFSMSVSVSSDRALLGADVANSVYIVPAQK
ncbi:Thiamin-phosphate pyrophosphorylase [hydrothermal vent metagenome]|uniref:Thiamin-phosphate pyrophosphorylase n=1 Tax=hydrothermal vent metagenome TaxID=652676 RepID=A0A3B0VNH6_9ZZZZ